MMHHLMCWSSDVTIFIQYAFCLQVGFVQLTVDSMAERLLVSSSTMLPFVLPIT